MHERPSIEYKKYDKSTLGRVFPQESADSSWNIGITAIHGNEPHRIVAALSFEISDILLEQGLVPPVLVLPAYTPTVERILAEEFPGKLDEIFISDELGDILKQTEFSSAGYPAHMQEVADKQPMVYQQTLDFLSRSFSARSLSGKTWEFNPSGRRLEINAGANVVASEPGQKNTHFYFPVVLSELVDGIMTDDGINFIYDPDTLETVLRYAQDFEQTYQTTQLGFLHTFSFQGDSYDTSGKILTPVIKKEKTPPPIYIENGIYVNASGSGIGVDIARDQARRLAAQGYQIVAPAWMDLPFATVAPPEAIFHPGIKAVIGRAGWGILWDAQRAGKPFADIGSGDYDNPEIRFNRRSIIEAGVGKAFSLRRGFMEELSELAPNVERLNRDIEEKLGLPEGYDGTRYSAEQIIEAELQRLGR